MDKLVVVVLHGWVAVPLIVAVGFGFIVMILFRTSAGHPPGPSGSLEVNFKVTIPAKLTAGV
jgi:hypothetical protein